MLPSCTACVGRRWLLTGPTSRMTRSSRTISRCSSRILPDAAISGHGFWGSRFMNQKSHREHLIAGGFRRAGVWRRDEATGSIRFDGKEPLPRTAGVYAYVVDHEVRYIGSAQRGLRTRLRHYEIAKTLRTAHRIRQEILALAATGHEVEIFTIVPPPMLLGNVLPIDTVAGLEEGLIRSIRPIWNRRGMGMVDLKGCKDG
jgi:hypothetical protein